MTIFVPVSLAIIIGLFWAILSYRVRLLSRSSALLLLVAAITIIPFHWPFFVVILAFVLSAGGLALYREGDKSSLYEIVTDVGAKSFWQGVANGGLAVLLAWGYTVFPDDRVLAAFVGSVAAVNADNWATELGVLSKSPPRLVTTWKRVPPGTSGAVSALGELMTLAGGIFIGATASVGLWLENLTLGTSFPWWVLPVSAIAGLIGSSVDTLIGATVQARYYCDIDHKFTEKTVDSRGHVTRLVGGVRWIDNNVVNAAASFAGAIAAVLSQALLMRLA